MRQIYVLYFFGCIREIIPIYPLYAILISERGISPFELSVLFSIWAAVGILFAIPSGALADRFSRKWLIAVSGLFKSAAFLCWYQYQYFWGFAAGFFLWGLGSTLKNGAWEALLYDLLEQRDEATRFTAHYGRITSLATIGIVLGELAGGVLIYRGYDVVLLVSAAMPLVAAIPFMMIVREPARSHVGVAEDYLLVLGRGVREALTRRAILFILLAYAGVIVMFGVYDEYASPTLRDNGFSLSTVAFLGVLILLSQSAGSFLAEKVEHISLGQLFFLIACSAVSLLLIPFSSPLIVASLMAVFFFMFGLSSTLFQGHLQSEIIGRERATITSVVGVADGIGAIFWFLAFGVMANMTSFTIATAGMGIAVILLSGLMYWLALAWRIVRPDGSSR